MILSLHYSANISNINSHLCETQDFRPQHELNGEKSSCYLELKGLPELLPLEADHIHEDDLRTRRYEKKRGKKIQDKTN